MNIDLMKSSKLSRGRPLALPPAVVEQDCLRVKVAKTLGSLLKVNKFRYTFLIMLIDYSV